MSDPKAMKLRSKRPPVPKAQRADTMERAHKAWHARLAGATWRQAAEVAGYANGDIAATAVKRVYGKVPPLEREALRTLWRERLELAWRQAVVDMTEQRPGAITAAVRIASAAAALDGLNAPTQVDVTVLQTLEALQTELVAHDL